MKEITLKNITLKLLDEINILNKQNAVRVISDTQNVILSNQEIYNVEQIIEKNFRVVYDFYASKAKNKTREISALDIETISVQIVLEYLYMYNMWRNNYKNKADLSLEFDKKDFSSPKTADVIFYYCRKKYPNNWLKNSAILLGISQVRASLYYKERESFYNK